jgi:hypothetical protein
MYRKVLSIPTIILPNHLNRLPGTALNVVERLPLTGKWKSFHLSLVALLHPVSHTTDTIDSLV